MRPGTAAAQPSSSGAATAQTSSSDRPDNGSRRNAWQLSRAAALCGEQLAIRPDRAAARSVQAPAQQFPGWRVAGTALRSVHWPAGRSVRLAEQ